MWWILQNHLWCNTYWPIGSQHGNRTPLPTYLFKQLLESNSYDSVFLPAATKLSQGNVFTGVCDSVHGGGGLPQCMLGYPQSRPPRADPLQEQPPPPQEQIPPQSRPPKSRHPPGSRPPTGSRLRHTVNERPVRILLECILVLLLNFHLVSIVAQELLQQWMADKLTLDNNFDDEDDELETPRKTQSEIKVEPIFTIT